MPSGSGEQQITPWDLRAADSAWSPDGALISFRSEPSRAQEYVGHLYTVTPDGSGLTQVTDHEDGTMVLGSSFSPDSRWIAFARGGVGGMPDIYVMRRDGSDLATITETQVWDSAPDWTAG